MKKIALIVLPIIVVAAVAAWLLWPEPEPVKAPPPELEIFDMPQDEEPEPMTTAPERERIAVPSNKTVELMPRTEEEEEAEAPEPTTEEPQQKTGDAVVRPGFVEDLAEYAVDRYYPQGTHPDAEDSGVVKLTLKGLNMRYGLEMTGLRHLSEDVVEARNEILGYVLRSSILDVAYELYAEQFVRSVVAEAEQTTKDYLTDEGTTVEKAMTPEQIKGMLARYSERMLEYSSLFRSLAGTQNLFELTQQFQDAQEKALTAHSEFIAALNNYRELKELSEDPEVEEPIAPADVQRAKEQMDEAGNYYSETVQAREQAKEALVQNVCGNLGPDRPEDSECLYAAQWFHRRKNILEDTDPLLKAADTMEGLAELFARKAQTYTPHRPPGSETDAAEPEAAATSQ